MFNLSVIPILVFLIILLPIVIIGFFKSARWSIMFLIFILISGLFSFALSLILYDPVLKDAFNNLLSSKIKNNMDLDQANDISKSSVIGLSMTMTIIPLSLLISCIFFLMRKWLNEPLGEKTEVVSNNEKTIIKTPNLKKQKLISGTISSFSGLFLASTVASACSIVLTPSYKNQSFNKMVNFFSFPVSYGNGYNKDWEKLYGFMDESKEYVDEINYLREIINFNSFQGDATTNGETNRLDSVLKSIDKDKMIKYFAPLADSDKLTDSALRVVLGKYLNRLSNNIIAKDKAETSKESEFDSFVSSLNYWVNSQVGNTIGLKNKEGIKTAFKKLLDKKHSYNKSYYYKNKVSLEESLKLQIENKNKSIKKFNELKSIGEKLKYSYGNDFNKFSIIAKSLQNQIDSWIAEWKKLGEGEQWISDSNNPYPTFPNEISDFASTPYLTKDLHSGLKGLYDLEFGEANRKNHRPPSGRILSNNGLMINNPSISKGPNTLAQKLATTYRELYGNGDSSSPSTGSLQQINNAKETEWRNKLAITNLSHSKLQRFKRERNDLISRIDNEKRSLSIKKTELQNYESERLVLIREIKNLNIQESGIKTKITSTENDLLSAQQYQTTAKNKLNQSEKTLEQKKQSKETADQNLLNAKTKLKSISDRATQDWKDAKYNLKIAEEEQTKTNQELNDAKKDLDNSQINLDRANQNVQRVSNLLSRQRLEQAAIISSLNQKSDRLNLIQGNTSKTSPILQNPALSGSWIHQAKNAIKNLENSITSLSFSLTSKEKEIFHKNNDYITKKHESDTKEIEYRNANNNLNNKLDTYNNQKNEIDNSKNILEKKLNKIEKDIQAIKNYADSVPAKWQKIIDNSHSQWQIKGNATSFNPTLPSLPTFPPIDKTGKSLYNPPSFRKIPFEMNDNGGHSIAYLDRYIEYLNRSLERSAEVNVVMKDKFNQRLESIKNSLVTLLT